jgi:hypothetical protein
VRRIFRSNPYCIKNQWLAQAFSSDLHQIFALYFTPEYWLRKAPAICSGALVRAAACLAAQYETH